MACLNRVSGWAAGAFPRKERSRTDCVGQPSLLNQETNMRLALILATAAAGTVALSACASRTPPPAPITCADGTTVPAGSVCPTPPPPPPPPPVTCPDGTTLPRSEEHTSELQSPV